MYWDICCWRPLPTHTYKASRAHEIVLVGTVDGRGYDGQRKYRGTICDACRPYHSILSILRSVFRRNRQIRCVYNSLSCLDLKIWQFLCPRRQRCDCFTHCACAWDKKTNLESYKNVKFQKC